MAMVESQMSYLEPWESKSERPYIRGKVEDQFPRSNFENREYKVQVKDARSAMHEFDLDTHGFAFYKDNGICSEVVDAIRKRDKVKVEDMYYPDVVKLVLEKTGATRVIVFDHTYRRRDNSLAPNANPNGNEQPATLILGIVKLTRCGSAVGAVGRVKRHAGPEAEKLLQKRVQIINVWRPIHGVVEDWALAVMDYRTIKPSEIHPTSIFRERYEMQGQTVSINYSPDQRWYYLQKQQPLETTFIKIWDSEDNVAKMCAHCAFPDPNAHADVQPRESIEVRCLVFYDEV